MTKATPMLSPWGIPEGDLQLLIARGSRAGELTMDQVVDVLRTIEFTAEVIEGVRSGLAAAGIRLDESVAHLDLSELEDDLPPVELSSVASSPPESVEAELHAADDAAVYAAGDF